jgi:hypothetical protein
MLDAAGYLARVVAPGPYYAFAFKRPEWTGLRHRFFQQADVKAAADWLSHEIGSAYDVWVGVASYRDAAQIGIDQHGNPRFVGKRTQANAEKLKVFWYDADIARPGDGKDPSRVWQSDLEVVGWLAQAKKAGLPVPNTWIRSGYGIHFYWVMDAALSAAQWLPYGQAFRALLAKLGARGDIGISADSARILRVPGTYNHKIPTAPALCCDITPANIPTTYPIKDFLKILDPSLSFTTGSNLGAPPSSRPVSKLNANAQANISHPPPYDFDQVAVECPQVARSQAEGGQNDRRQLWHHMINLAYACRDQEAAHRIGDKHPKYSRADTDAKYAQTEREHQGKDFGAPTCASLDMERKGVCDTCPHLGKIKSPYSLGKPSVATAGMPSGYRQTATAIERWHKEDWAHLVYGTISNIHLLRFNDHHYRLVFDYVLSGAIHHAGIDDTDLYVGVDRMRQTFVKQGISTNRYNTSPFGDLVMAWIEELKRGSKWIEAPSPFGWVIDHNGVYLGLSVGGTFYCTDGTYGPTQPGDRKIHESYQPSGNLAKWQEAAEFVTKGRPDLQVLVAASFAAPLMEFTGISSVMSVWSMRSGARKTSAFHVGSSVWCNPISGMSAIHDTINSVQHSLAETRIMPVYWDEVHVSTKEQRANMVEMTFNITQGRGKARLDSKIEQRAVGTWRTMLIMSGNQPFLELVQQDRAHTDAGTLRVFEFQIDFQNNQVIEASRIVDEVKNNYGHAGRIFAEWAASHIPDIRNFIIKLQRQLELDLKTIEVSERFHIATILGVVAGAYFANHLKLIAFDVKGIYRFLINKMLEQRLERESENPVQDESKYLAMVFERFVSDNTDETLVTQCFTPGGNPKLLQQSDRIKIVKPPGIKCDRVKVHIGLDNQEMRFDRKQFASWCHENNKSASAELKLMERLWPIRRTRAVLGIGTNWSSGGKVIYYTLRLTTPELQHHLGWGTPSPAATGNVVPLKP